MASSDDISEPQLVQKSGPQRFFEDIVELMSWRFKADGQEMVQTSINQVFNAHPTALAAMYLDWRQAVALERAADALEGQV